MEHKALILDEYNKNCGLYGGFANRVKQLLEDLIRGEGIQCNAITCRLKERDSLADKIDRKHGKYICLADLTDVAAVRIITYYSDGVDKAAELVEKEFEVDRENSIDRRASLEPDRFGYCSVHYVVSMTPQRLALPEYQPYGGLKCEIQIRTVLQHAWAEIEHDLGYKSENAIPRDIRRNFSRLAGLLEIGDKEFLEIRNFLADYTEKVPEQLVENRLDDRELDAVILEELAKTDAELLRIDREIEAVSSAKLLINTIPFDCEDDIARLHWLNIRTLRQLKEMAKRNERAAVDIAKIIFSHDDDDDPGFFDETISLYYLCLAELLKKYHDRDAISDFVRVALDRRDEAFVDQLLEIQKRLGL